MRRFRPKYFALFLFVSFAGCKNAVAQEYIFNHLSTRDGLLSNNVLSLYQDGKGFLWTGTDVGMQVYDGYRFTTVNTKNLTGPVEQILEDGKGRVWLRSDKTVGLFDAVQKTFTAYAFSEGLAGYNDGLFQLRLDGEKRIFVAVEGAGAFYLNKDGTAFSKAAAPFSFPKEWAFYDMVHDAAQKRYWLYGPGGLAYFDAADGRFYTHGPKAVHPLLKTARLWAGVTHFYIDRQRRYWAEKWDDKAYTKEFHCYDEKKKAFTTDTAGLRGAGNHVYFEIHRFTEFADTTVLVYGLNCMSMAEHGVFTGFRSPVYTPYSLQFDVVNDVLEDREHILWVATDDGLYSTMANINNNRHKMIGQQGGRSVINCLLEDEAKNVWLGMWGRKPIVLDSTLEKNNALTGLFEKAPSPALKMSWDLHRHSRTKKIYIGCQEGTLAIFDPATSRLQTLQPDPFEHRTVRQLEEDDEGKLWAGLQSGRLFCFNPLNLPLRFDEVQRFNGFITKLKFDKGSLWIAVRKGGLYLLDVKSKALIKTFNGETGSSPGSDINDILPVNDTTCLLASDALYILNPLTGRRKRIAFYNNVPLGRVYALQRAAHHECWFSTANGVYRYNRQTGNLVKYSQWDGLVTVFNNSFVMEQSLALKDGALVFAGNQNFVRFNPAQYEGTTVPPPVRLTAFSLGGTPLPVDSITGLPLLRLTYRQNSFAVDFAALAFTQLEKLTYEYKLEGADNAWTSANLPQTAKYSLLPSGDYRFVVRVKNSEGVYAKTDARLHIVIAAPFWKTTPFVAALLLMATALFYYLHRLRVKRLLHVERVRSRLARDLHDDMGSTLSTINILSNMALQQKGLDEKTNKNFMAKISESTAQMMEAMDDIIWSINPLNDSMGKVLARMKQVAGSVLEPQEIDYRFEAEEAVKGLSFTMEGRREIFLIYKEAVNNIVKYAKCTKVDVVLKKEAGRFVLIIKDNGIGFTAQGKKETAPTRGNGFTNMKKRAEALRGGLQISSAEKAGTQITLSIPFA